MSKGHPAVGALSHLADVQNQQDHRRTELDRVGITKLFYPLSILQKSGARQNVTAAVDLSVGLHRDQRGAHLSSLIEILHDHRDRVSTVDDLVSLLRHVRAHQDERGRASGRAEARTEFKYFISRSAPVSGTTALVSYDCGFHVAIDRSGFKSVTARIPISIVCPCSLAISDIGAHNQRAVTTVQIWWSLEDDQHLWLEDIISLAESCGSSDIHSALKRPDEKAVTEQIFRTPRFVEDVVREAVMRIRSQMHSIRYSVICESFESIHGHNAYAETSGSVGPQVSRLAHWA
jgi:GTP cyclohydrolase I